MQPHLDDELEPSACRRRHAAARRLPRTHRRADPDAAETAEDPDLAHAPAAEARRTTRLGAGRPTPSASTRPERERAARAPEPAAPDDGRGARRRDPPRRRRPPRVHRPGRELPPGARRARRPPASASSRPATRAPPRSPPRRTASSPAAPPRASARASSVRRTSPSASTPRPPTPRRCSCSSARSIAGSAAARRSRRSTSSRRSAGSRSGRARSTTRRPPRPRSRPPSGRPSRAGPGPALLSLPEDVLDLPLPEDTRVPVVRSHPEVPNAADVRAVLHFLAAAERPVILAGAGVLRARCSNDLVRFAELLHVPVIASWRRGDVIPNDHPLYLGMAGLRGARRRSASGSPPPTRCSSSAAASTSPRRPSTACPALGQRWMHVDLEPRTGAVGFAEPPVRDDPRRRPGVPAGRQRAPQGGRARRGAGRRA